MKRITSILLLLFINIVTLTAKPYKGAELRTTNLFRYGRFEVRMKSGQGSGMLSSFFTYNDGPNLPANWNEIDIEIMGRYDDQVQFNVISQWQTNHVYSVQVPFNPHDGFHEYAIEWTPDYVAWFVDGYEVYRQTGEHIDNLFFTQKLMMNIWQPTYVDWAGEFNPAILPVFAYYDWVKYYAYTPGVNHNFTLQWTDHFNSWDQSRWAKATHTWNGNNVDFIHDNAVFFDGYMILCLTTPGVTGYSNEPVDDTDSLAPYIVWARTFEEYFCVYFSEPVTVESAEDTDNYIVAGISINSAQLQSDQRTVIVYATGIESQAQYNLIVKGISDVAQPANVMSIEFIISKQTLPLPLKINTGGEAWDQYIGDQEWRPELEYGYTAGVFVDYNTVPIQGTTEQRVYQTELRDPTFYQIRVPKGTYSLTFKFAENQYSSSGQRIFNVYVEENEVIHQLDIFSQAGAHQALEIPVSQMRVDDGILDIYFEDITGVSLLNGIEAEYIASAIGNKSELPKKFDFRVYPNPFNNAAKISFDLSAKSHVQIDMFDISGRKVRTVSNAYESSGSHTKLIHADNLSSGIYLLAVSIDSKRTYSHKLLLLK